MDKRMSEQVKMILYTAVIMVSGIILLKFIPMKIFGSEILFDASLHIIIASFILYFIYFFIDENKSWRIPYFIFAFAVVIIISVQRIISNRHNDIGILLGIVIVIISILIPRWKGVKSKIKF